MAVGEDSFMDTIANLVGIMIILVVIVAARGYTTAKVQARVDAEEKFEQMDAPKLTTVQLSRDLEEQLEDLREYELELMARSAERMSLVDRVNLAEQAFEEKMRGIDRVASEDIQVQLELSQLEKELAELTQQAGNLPPSEIETVALQHLPTPMAKTVFGKELHVMMQDNLVTVIPWDALVETLKQQVQRTVSRNTQRERIEDSLGPIDGFMMRYRLISRNGIVSDGRSSAMGRMVELEKFELDPTSDIIRESVVDSLRSGGRLRSELDAFRSQQTTITVWVYPESFGEFRQLKESLFREGFLCAARPLPTNMRIGASPRGSTSAAQ
jgi:HAMP domain-containing protein